MQVSLVAAIFLAGAMSFAQSGEAVYRDHCQMCHGAAGIPNPWMAKMMGVKPVTDPALKKMGETEMIAATRNGMGKMQPFRGKLTDTQIRDAVAYFRTFIKK
jgi:mono/diheme cytochrome c family protein